LLDTGSQVGVASVPLVVVLSVLGYWAGLAREDKRAAEARGERASAGVVSGAQGVQIGDSNTQNNYYLAGEHAGQGGTAGAGNLVVGDVPQEPAAFQPRAGLMEALEAAGGPGVFAVTGIRGVGKTQVAAACARRRIAEGWRLVAWVDASDEASVLVRLADVAVAAGVGPAGEDERVLAERVRHWLETDGDQRLVVFDNAVDLDGLRPFLPAAGAARVIVTSTRRPAENLGLPVPVEVFTEAEALGFLAERTKLDDVAGARELATELGFLPLGLAQAAALIAREHLSYGTYLGRLRALPVARYLGRAEGDVYPYRLDEAIMLSLRAVEASDASGVCGRLMGLVAVLAEAGVPRWVLHLAANSRVLGRACGEAEVDAAEGVLADASLLGFTTDDSVAAHRLVMRVARERLVAEGTLPRMLAGAVRVLEGLAGGMDEAWRDPGGVRELARQVSAVSAHVASYPDALARKRLKSLLKVRMQSAYLLATLGDSAQLAILAAEPLVTDCERLLGSNHPDTLGSRGILAAGYWDVGRTDEAIALFERTLADCERMLGSRHPLTSSLQSNLALAYQDAGRIDEAIALDERTLADRERLLGSNHPDSLGSRSNLARAYRAAGRIDEAIALDERTLADRKRLLGSKHPHTLTSRGNLASAYHEAGRTDESIALLEQTLADRERLRGSNHPDTLESRNNLAVGYRAAGRIDEAIALHERTLADCEGLLGNDNPHTMTARVNLASAYHEAGRTDESIALLEQTLADRERLRGSKHPDTLESRNILAAGYWDVGRTDESIALLERTLADCERLMGSDNPNTVESRNNLANAYDDAGRTDESIALLERTLADCERLMGSDNPSTLAARNNLANAYDHAGRTDKAIPLLEQTLADCKRLLGTDHPGTNVVRENLAALTGKSAHDNGK
jgi:tetratricopeptide (TPR) repeat protein